MKKIHVILAWTAALAIVPCLVSCELDNYGGPDAQIYGEVRDSSTGELIQQDLNEGSQIIYIEHGYEDPDLQRMNFKTDGTYRNNLVFSGVYDFYFEETNFVIPERLNDYKIKEGENRLDFNVQPYIRISDVSHVMNGNEITFTFKVTPTVDNAVSEVGIFAHVDYVAGNWRNNKKVTQTVGESFKDQTREYTLTMDVSDLTKFSEYYFRVGALIDVANAKYNYAPGEQIKIR